MKKNSITKTLSLLGTTVFMLGALAGCGNVAQPDFDDAKVTVIEDEMVAKAANISSGPYLTKGVYANYAKDDSSKDYFYVFYDEGAGYTEDANTGTGLPFCCVQSEGVVVFSYGGYEGTKDVFVVTDSGNGTITGKSEDGRVLVFEAISDADPDTFVAQNYVKKVNGLA